jgi:hypothetical protein
LFFLFSKYLRQKNDIVVPTSIAKVVITIFSVNSTANMLVVAPMKIDNNSGLGLIFVIGFRSDE